MSFIRSFKFNPRIFTIALLGFTSALPLPLISSNLSLWLAEAGMERAAIAGFALLHLPYSLRILWSPLIESFPCPIFNYLGQRRSWTVLSLILCQAAILFAGLLGPHSTGFLFCVLFISLFSGWIYLAGVSYEVNVLSSDEYRLGSTWVIIGYRLGLLFSGAGTLYFANFFGWQIAYILIGLMMSVGVVTILTQPEPKRSDPFSSPSQKKQGWILSTFQGLTLPILDLFKRKNWLILLLFLFTYRLGQNILDRMIGPFYLEIGFSKIEIANATKIVGMAATFCGALYAGHLLKKMSVLKGLFLFAAFHAFSHGCLWIMSLIGKEPYWFYVTIFAEQFTSGMMITGLIAYLWSHCQPAFAAAQYTFLWSLISFNHDLFASFGGALVNLLGWPEFFLLSIGLSCPCLFLLAMLIRSEQTPLPKTIPQMAMG